MVVTIVFFVLASIFVALRFVSRWGIVRKIALHDHIMLLAWVCMVLLREQLDDAESRTDEYVTNLDHRFWLHLLNLLWHHQGTRPAQYGYPSKLTAISQPCGICHYRALCEFVPNSQK
jgi:hypothetical protein